jgi:hypothetical protein
LTHSLSTLSIEQLASLPCAKWGVASYQGQKFANLSNICLHLCCGEDFPLFMHCSILSGVTPVSQSKASTSVSFEFLARYIKLGITIHIDILVTLTYLA